jgi:carotenoid cleavage dioxygenase-like enzyme
MINNINSLYDLFMGDGVIQGVFFENGNLTYVSHLIKTEKVLHEEKYGHIPKNNLLTLIFLVLNRMRLFPNVLGMANTAILNVKNDNNIENYALFERDYPYLLDIDFKNHDIKTVKKIHIPFLSHFSGHSKTTNTGDIETIDYKIFRKQVNYALLNKKFELIEQVEFKFKYLPIVHDFFSNDELIVLIDSPLLIDFTQDVQKTIPVYLDKNKKTFIYVYDKREKKCQTYIYDYGFYTFHYAYVNDKKDVIQIYISQYDELNFENVNIKGSYRMIEINKKTKEIKIHKNNELESYNLDFPICFNDKVILRKIENRSINGFIITKGLKIYKKILFENKNICGEHNVIYIKNIPFLIFFNIEEDKKNKTNRNLLTLINLNNYDIIDIEIQNKLTLGFHSIFLHNLLFVN